MAWKHCSVLAWLAVWGAAVDAGQGSSESWGARGQSVGRQSAQARACPIDNAIGLERPKCGGVRGGGVKEVNMICSDARYCETLEVVRLITPTVVIWNTIGCSACPDEEWDRFWEQHGAWSSGTWALLATSIFGLAGIAFWKVKGNDLGLFGWILLVLLLLLVVALPVSEIVSRELLRKNGPRSWNLDSIVQTQSESEALMSDGTIKFAAFNGIGHVYVATIVGLLSQPGPFERLVVERSTVWKFGKNRQVYMVTAPNAQGGEDMFVMQSHHVRSNSLADLFGLKERLPLPSGWDYQCKVVGENGLNLEAPDGTATILQDNFENTYMLLVDPGNCFPFSEAACTQETEETIEEYRRALCDAGANGTGRLAAAEGGAQEAIV